MAWLKVYEWEHQTFPWAYRANVRPQFREPLIRGLAQRFGLSLMGVLLNGRDGHGVHYRKKIAYGRSSLIRLPSYGVRCAIGVILHELAHAYNWQKNGQDGHTGTFRHALIRLMVDGKRELRNVMPEVVAQIKKDKAETRRVAQREARTAQHKFETAERQKSRAYKIELKRKQVVRLRRKIKSLTTRLKSAERSLAVLERLEKTQAVRQLVAEQYETENGKAKRR